jgi:hypothetical protein
VGCQLELAPLLTLLEGQTKFCTRFLVIYKLNSTAHMKKKILLLVVITVPLLTGCGGDYKKCRTEHDWDLKDRLIAECMEGAKYYSEAVEKECRLKAHEESSFKVCE